ncbi:MAG TPA: ATP-binding protein [Candidatus Merdicola faecigallinarum]|uniref:ATP-binding protein n=1 Tax=Candidatus Merdicola faecigallinarum TaxID=2840862 RepID=A0A9D1M1W6_9FIRM|nr:ATP-binding protein [Candidatus Merdicola faecigallinarum]
MSTNILKDLLKEYEQKRLTSQRNLEKKKETLFSSHPELKEIEEKLNQFAIKSIQSLLNNKEDYQQDNFQLKIKELQEEKARILRTLSLSEKDLQPEYECSLCQDTGYIMQGEKTVMCSCLKQKLIDISYNQSNIRNLDIENFSNFRFDLYSNEKNPEKYNSDISPRENMKRIKKIVDDFIIHFSERDEKSLLFTGNTGLGKTFLSNCIAKEMMDQGKIVIYQTAPSMLNTMIDYRFGKKEVSIDFYDNIMNSDLLIIDDLGTESTNNIKSTELFNIINTRLLNQVKTIISTNLTLQNLFSIYDERIVSRIVGNYNICRFFGDDIRFHMNRNKH